MTDSHVVYYFVLKNIVSFDGSDHDHRTVFERGQVVEMLGGCHLASDKVSQAQALTKFLGMIGDGSGDFYAVPLDCLTANSFEFGEMERMYLCQDIPAELLGTTELILHQLWGEEEKTEQVNAGTLHDQLLDHDDNTVSASKYANLPALGEILKSCPLARNEDGMWYLKYTSGQRTARSK